MKKKRIIRTVRLSEEAVKKLEKEAKKQERSQNWVLEKLIIKSLPLIAVFLMAGCGEFGDYKSEASGTNQLTIPERFDALRNAFYDYLERSGIKNGQISFFADGTLSSQAYGDMKLTDISRIASCSKIITAAGVLKAESMGLLNTEDHLVDYFQPVGGDVDNITISNLLSHSSGWDRAQMAYYPLSKEGLKSVVDRFGSLSVDNLFLYHSSYLQYTPETKQAYSSMGYVFLSHILEKASGMSYEDFIHRNISDRLILDKNLSFIKGTAGWKSSARDYLKLLLTLYEDPNYQKLWEVPQFVTASMKDYVFTHGARAVEINGQKAFICEGYLEGATAYGAILDGGKTAVMVTMQGGNNLEEIKELVNRFLK